MRFVTLTALSLALLGHAGLAMADEVVLKGTFSGASNHTTAGAVSVVKGDAGAQVVLGDDFSLDGAPDPKLGFGNDGAYDTASQFSVLGANTGAQTYDLPADVDPTKYNEIYVWCEQYAVPLGVAKLQ